MERARELGIDWIAITDHNSLANCPAYEKVAEEFGIAFTWGVEIQSAEEVHVLAYFEDASSAKKFDKKLYDSLLPIANDPEFFGDQVIIDENEGIINVVERALINSSVWTIDEVVDRVKSFGGFIVPAHVDADVNSIYSQLGFLPEPDQFDAYGITAKVNIEVIFGRFPGLRGKCLIRSSDAHYLADLGSGKTELYIEKPCLTELILAHAGIDGRKIKI